MEILKINNLYFGYNNQDILKNINITINEKDFICIIGENGSGKSTFIKCILGLNNKYKGEIINNEKIGYLPQMTEIQNNFPASIEEIVLSGTIPNNTKKIWYSKEDKVLANKIMMDLELYDIRKKCFRELSGGQKQRVLIARALCMESKILILDEPVNGLDPKIVEQIYKILYKLNKENEKTILMISHDVDRSINYCNRIIEIKNGEIIFNDKPSKYKNEGGIKND